MTRPTRTAPTSRVAAQVSIRASRERVWALLTDFSSMHRWFVGLSDVRMEEEPPRVGAHRRVTFTGGITHLETIHTWAPPVRLTLASAGHSRLVTSGDVDIRLAEDGEGVRLDWSITYGLNLPPFAVALSRPLVQVVVGAALRRSLVGLKRLVETSVRDYPG